MGCTDEEIYFEQRGMHLECREVLPGEPIDTAHMTEHDHMDNDQHNGLARRIL